MAKALKSVVIDGTEYILRHVGQPSVNGGRCNQYEVRTILESGDYHQRRDIYVPLGRSADDHLRGIYSADECEAYAA